MQKVAILLICVATAGCASWQKTGTAYHDEYDAIKVEQTVANNVSPMPFQRTIVCLNPRRETRRVNAITNPVVSVITNVTLTYVTNQTITVTTNLTRTLSTNQFAMPTPLTVTNESGVETNFVTTLVSTPPPNSTNNTVTATANVTLSRGPSQTALTASHQQVLNNQVTLNTTNMNLTTADNQVVSIETNVVVNTYTNVSVVAVTNQSVIYTNIFVREYYVYTEFTPPQDFTLQSSGENLVLLVDGVRHGLIATNSQTSFVSRKGYQSTIHHVSPELIEGIANAKEVKMRLKGVNNVIERKLSAGSRNNFRRFMLKYFTPGPSEDEPQTTASHNFLNKYETN